MKKSWAVIVPTFLVPMSFALAHPANCLMLVVYLLLVLPYAYIACAFSFGVLFSRPVDFTGHLNWRSWCGREKNYMVVAAALAMTYVSENYMHIAVPFSALSDFERLMLALCFVLVAVFVLNAIIWLLDRVFVNRADMPNRA